MTGWLLILAAGICQGGFMAPMKFVKGWKWENSWFIFATTAYLICPWLFVTMTTSQAIAIYMDAGVRSIAIVMAMGLLWGFGALTFGLGVDALGLSIGFAVILGVAATSGTLVPLLLLNESPPPSTALMLTIISLAVMLTGVAICSLAGRWREKEPGRSSYGRGILLCIISGLLSSCGNLGFVLGKPIVEIAIQHGVSSDFAPNLVWSLLTVSLFLCNAIYSGQKLISENTFSLFRSAHWVPNLLCCIAMGVLWMLGFVFYGVGTRNLGAMGSSLGWSVLMGSMVMTANVLGLLTGEWRGAPADAMRRLWIGVGLLCVAILGLGLANRMAQ